MRNVNVNVYEFDELSKDVQDEIIARYRYRLADFLEGDLKSIMNIEFHNHVNLDFVLSYSLNCCQGDGVSFTGSVEGKEELLTLASLVYDNKIPKNILRLIKWGIIYEVDFTRKSHHYVHKYTVTITIIDNYNIGKDYCHISRAMAEFEKAINEWYLQTCDNLEKIGYDTIEILYGDDNIRCYIDENSLEFYEDGYDYK